jgi:hypothetical protein
MVEKPHIDERKRARELCRNAAVCLARLAIPRRVIVAEDDGRSVVIERSLDDLAGIDGCAVYGPAKQRLEADDTVARVEKETTENLVREVAEPGAKALGRITRFLEYPAPIERPFEMASPELDSGVQASDARAAQPVHSQELARARTE